MSVWTHVAGIIRIDDFGFSNQNKIRAMLGNIIHFEDSMEMWAEQENHPEKFTPTGSEGGIQYDVLVNLRASDIRRFTIPICGDLRDYDDVDEIKRWFERIIYDEGLIIRDAILSIQVEGMESVVIPYGNRMPEIKGKYL